MTSYERTNENAAFVLLKPEGVLQSKTAPGWRNWQTRRTQNAVGRKAANEGPSPSQFQQEFLTHVD